LSYLITRKEEEKILYYEYGPTVSWTDDIKQARLYERESSANQAKAKLEVRPEKWDLTVEYSYKR